MKFLINGLSDNRGGIESVVLNYCDVLYSNGHTFDFISTTGTISEMDRVKKWGSNVYKVGRLKNNPFAFIKSLRRIMIDNHYDVFWDNRDSIANLSYIWLAYLLGIRIRIMHAHTSENLGGKIKGIVHFMNRALFVRIVANRYWAVSKNARDYFFPYSIEAKVDIVPNCIDFKKFSFSNSKRDFFRNQMNLEGKKVLLMVGSVQYPKNQKIAIDAIKQLNESEIKWVLLIAGDGTEKTKLEEYVCSINASNYVIFLGLITNVVDMLQVADIYLMPSIHEGLPVSLLEAQINGLPCVISQNISEEAIISKEVYSLDPYDCEKWVDCIKRINMNQSHDNKLLSRSLLFDLNETGKSISEYLNNS